MPIYKKNLQRHKVGFQQRLQFPLTGARKSYKSTFSGYKLKLSSLLRKAYVQFFLHRFKGLLYLRRYSNFVTWSPRSATLFTFYCGRFFFKKRRRARLRKFYFRWRLSRLSSYLGACRNVMGRPRRFLMYYWYVQKTKNNYFMTVTDSRFSVKIWENSFTAGGHLGRKASSPLALDDLSLAVYRRFVELCGADYLNFVSTTAQKRRYPSVRLKPLIGIVFMFNSAVGRYKKFLTNFILNRLFVVKMRKNKNKKKKKRSFNFYRLVALIWRKRIPFNGCYAKARRRRKNKRRKIFTSRLGWSERRVFRSH